MDSYKKLIEKRDGIFEKIGSIKTMKRGTINEQYLKVPQKNSSPALRGPYYVFSKSSGGKTTSKRIKKEDLENVKNDIAQYHKFVKLTEEFVEVTEKITDIIRTSDDLKDEVLKKNKHI